MDALQAYWFAKDHVNRIIQAGYLWENEYGTFGEDGSWRFGLKAVFDTDLQCLWFQVVTPIPIHHYLENDDDDDLPICWDGVVTCDNSVWQPHDMDIQYSDNNMCLFVSCQ